MGGGLARPGSGAGTGAGISGGFSLDNPPDPSLG
jgi:hypothetical protein